MAMAAKNDGQQMYLIDPLPEPTNYQEWMDWLRKECKVSVKWGEESDFYKIAIDGENEEADKGGQFQCAELFLGDDVSNGKKLTDIAKSFYPFWKKTVLTKPKKR